MKEKYTIVIQRGDGERFTFVYYKGTNPFVLSLSAAIEMARGEFKAINEGELISAVKTEEKE